MRIGIVTFFRIANYGAMLQAYALWKYLEARGHKVVFIRHAGIVPRRMRLIRCLVSRRLCGVVMKVSQYVQSPISEFAADFPQTRFCRTLGEIQEETSDCDAFIVGSDQMWNPEWCSGALLPVVMLDFAREDQLRIAYAVSFGSDKWVSDGSENAVGRLLCKFTRISVREESGVSLVESLSGRTDAECLIDPALLLTAESYRLLMDGIPGPEGKGRYVFRYILHERKISAETERAFFAVRSQLGIMCFKSDRVPVRGFGSPLCRLLGVYAKLSLPNWLSELVHSDFVFTNSFHGTVFAILFHRPFVSLLLRGSMSRMNGRLLSLLSKLGLPERAVYADDIGKIRDMAGGVIDWKNVDERLSRLRDKTDGFFDKVVGGIGE